MLIVSTQYGDLEKRVGRGESDSRLARVKLFSGEIVFEVSFDFAACTNGYSLLEGSTFTLPDGESVVTRRQVRNLEVASAFAY